MKNITITLTVPDWANYGAIDKSGDYYIYEQEPGKASESFFPKAGEFQQIAFTDCECIDWENSLTKI